MNTIRTIFSYFGLPFTFPSFNMSPPCGITTEFFYLCGHTVASRHCRNDARLWRNNGYHDLSISCDANCPTRSLPTVIHMYLSCSWCRQLPRVPLTNSIRSDPGVDRLDPGELRRRQDFYLTERRARLTESARAAFFRNVGRRALWETHKRLEHEWQDSQDYSTMEGELCVICRESLTNRAAVRLPCGAVHRYHEECIERWLTENQNHTCAHCRQHFRILYYGEWTANDFVRYFVDYRPPPENE